MLVGVLGVSLVLTAPTMIITKLYKETAMIEVAEAERTRHISRAAETEKNADQTKKKEEEPEAEQVTKPSSLVTMTEEQKVSETAAKKVSSEQRVSEHLEVEVDQELPITSMDVLRPSVAKKKSSEFYLDLNLELGKNHALGSARGEKGKNPEHKTSHLPSVKAISHTSVTVIVVAYHATGRNETSFQLKMLTPLSKVMNAWCNEHKLDIQSAVFKVRTREIQSTDTLASLSYDPSRGPFVMRAFPRRSDADDTHMTDSDLRYMEDELVCSMEGVERGIV
jgi:hypothetical protein